MSSERDRMIAKGSDVGSNTLDQDSETQFIESTVAAVKQLPKEQQRLFFAVADRLRQELVPEEDQHVPAPARGSGEGFRQASDQGTGLVAPPVEPPAIDLAEQARLREKQGGGSLPSCHLGAS